MATWIQLVWPIRLYQETGNLKGHWLTKEGTRRADLS